MRAQTIAIGALIFGVAAGSARAQGSRASVIVKGGVNIERSEDFTEGESAAVGADLLVPIGSQWSFDAELWFPAFFTMPNGKRHRDILWSVGAIREWGSGRVRPFIGFGLGAATTQERSDLGETSRSGGFFHFGGGVRIPMGRRVALVPEVRATLNPGAGLVRPALGMEVRF